MNDNTIQEDIRKIKMDTLRVLFIGFLIIFFGLLSSLIYWIYFEESFITSKLSPSGEGEVVINEYGNWLTGSDTVKIYFKQDGKTKKATKVDVSFMEAIHEERFHIGWTDENRVSIIMVSERYNQELEYNFITQTIEIN